ncbi:MAG: cytidylate kinase [Microgenomates group bacterium LiPW_16]|nr:MAG: cytidylate kinase [Microgenomates group bacterium LiPW_16]
MKKPLQIAIDGPVGAGKSTVAALLSQRLGILYLDSGAMYRAVAVLGIRNKVDLKNEKEIVNLLKKVRIKFEDCRRIFLNNQDITQEIRTPEAGWGSSVVAMLPGVRRILVKKQKEMACSKSVIMEGRDITTRVLPNATLKIYLTADQKERAKRRHKEFLEKGIKKTFTEVLEETVKRDKQDTERKIDPLTIVPDAWVLDTTNLTIREVMEKILEKLKKLK